MKYETFGDQISPGSMAVSKTARLCGLCLLLGGFFPPLAMGATATAAIESGVEMLPVESRVEMRPAESELEARFAAALRVLSPDQVLKIDSITPSTLPGVYQVLVGTEVLYFSEDGRFVLRGDLYDLSARRNLTSDAASKVRARLLRELTAGDYIEFAAADPRHILYVFTDVDCDYCRRMHAEIKEYNELGFTVRYLAYPRAGIHSLAGKEMHKVWCASDRERALTLAKQGESFATKGCRSSVAEQYKLGNALGVLGTPGIFLANGSYISGYRPPQTMLLEVEDRSSAP